MRIGVNTLFLIPGVVGGTETYTREMLRAMTRLFPQDEFILFCNRENYGTFESAPNLRQVLCNVRAVNRPSRILYEQIILPRKVRREGVDVLLSAGHTTPRFLSCPDVLVVHESQRHLFPENFSRAYLFATKALMRMGCAGADRIIAVSRTLAAETARFEHVPSEKVVAIPHGVREEFFQPIATDRRMDVLRDMGITGSYILAVSNSYPHKNLPRLARAFAGMAGRIDCALTIVGPERNAETELRAACAGAESRIIRVRSAGLEQLRALYQSCHVFVLPSLYEGFGLPVLEAMASGAAVACSDIPVFHEVAGEAAEYFDPKSEASIAETISGLIAAPARRAQLSALGVLRAKEFTWNRAAEATMQTLREATALEKSR